MHGEEIWAVTAYFNPAGYRSRLANYRLFRSALGIPLLTVEHSISGAYELADYDADILLRVSSTDVLWQKERLLNHAFEQLPECARYVAWLDCDVMFKRGDWYASLPSILQRVAVAQCYSDLVDLGANERPEADGRRRTRNGRSVAWIYRSSRRAPSARWTTETLRAASPGGAWAARRDVIQALGLYDAMILGGGDRAFSCACFGIPDEEVTLARMKGRRAQHYRVWAEHVYSRVRGSVGVVPGTLYHLWHGPLSQRNYLKRHEDLAVAEFDPERDLRIGPSGAWEWSDEASASLRALVARYFQMRDEDAASCTRPTDSGWISESARL